MRDEVRLTQSAVPTLWQTCNEIYSLPIMSGAVQTIVKARITSLYVFSKTASSSRVLRSSDSTLCSCCRCCWPVLLEESVGTTASTV